METIDNTIPCCMTQVATFLIQYVVTIIAIALTFPWFIIPAVVVTLVYYFLKVSCSYSTLNG